MEVYVVLLGQQHRGQKQMISNNSFLVYISDCVDKLLITWGFKPFSRNTLKFKHISKPYKTPQNTSLRFFPNGQDFVQTLIRIMCLWWNERIVLDANKLFHWRLLCQSFFKVYTGTVLIGKCHGASCMLVMFLRLAAKQFLSVNTSVRENLFQQCLF